MNSVASVTAHNVEVKALFCTVPSYFMSTPAGTIINRLSQVYTLTFLVYGHLPH